MKKGGLLLKGAYCLLADDFDRVTFYMYTSSYNICAVFNNAFNIQYIYKKRICIYKNCLCGSVAKTSDTSAVGHGFEPRRTIKICLKILFRSDLI